MTANPGQSANNGKIRVVLATTFPYDERHVRGGVQAVALYLAKELSARDDVELHVITCSARVRRSISERRGKVQHHWIATLDRKLWGVRALTIDGWRVGRLVRRIAPDVVHVQTISEYGMMLPAAIPTVLTVHGVEPLVSIMSADAHYKGLRGAYRNGVFRHVARTNLAQTDALVSIAGGYVPGVLGPLLGDIAVHCIDNPIAKRWFGIPDERGDGFIVLAVGDIMARKNTLGLVRAFAAAAAQVPEARLEIAGGIKEPAYFASVEREVARLGLGDRVRFLGALNEEELLDAYTRAALVAQASVQETAPMALAQALAAGRAVVASSAGGTGWIVADGVTGLLAPVGDSAALAAGIVRLLGDADLRSRIGVAGRAAARQRFRANLVAARTVGVYRAMLTPEKGA